jgi:LysR substrate binding domain
VDEVVLITPAGHPLAGRSPVALERALDYDFVSLSRTASLTRKISAAAEATGRHLRIRIQARSFDTMCRMVSAGLGLTVLPRAGASLYADALGLKVMALKGFEVKRRLLLAMRGRAALSPAALALVESVEARVRESVGRLNESRGRPIEGPTRRLLADLVAGCLGGFVMLHRLRLVGLGLGLVRGLLLRVGGRGALHLFLALLRLLGNGLAGFLHGGPGLGLGGAGGGQNDGQGENQLLHFRNSSMLN